MSNSHKIPTFEEIPITTKTIIATTGWKVNLEKLFRNLPITEYSVLPKKRGRKKRDDTEVVQNDVSTGDIITLKFYKELRGVDLKRKHKKRKKCFRNSVTVVIRSKINFINFKVTENGKFQMTGCKDTESAMECTKKMFNYITTIKETHPDVCEFGDAPIYFRTVMNNIGFNVGFKINRENLDHCFNTRTEFNSLLETSFGYTGVNFKIPIGDEVANIRVHHMKHIEGDAWEHGDISLSDFNTLMGNVDTDKPKYHTFLCFHSGSCIFSSMSHEIMKPIYTQFMDMITSFRGDIIETVV